MPINHRKSHELQEETRGEQRPEQETTGQQAAENYPQEHPKERYAEELLDDATMDLPAIEEEPQRALPEQRFNPHQVWQTVLSELSLKMPSATFDTWVRDTWVIAYEDGEFIIGMPNAYARDWLENRLRAHIKRTLTSLIKRSVQVNFQVQTRRTPGADESDRASARRTRTYQAPLYGWVDDAASNEADDAPNAAAHDVTHSTPRNMNVKNSVANHATNNAADNAAGEQPRSLNGSAPEGKRGQRRLSELSASGGAEYAANSHPASASGYPSTPAARRHAPMQNSGGLLLNFQHTFDSFVVGNHNRLAHAAAFATAEQPGESFNPLFIYGGVGLGKTHLLHAIGNYSLGSGHNVLYCSSEQFTNDLITAIRGHNTLEFRHKYRQVDVLLIDDIQFIGGKESTQEEFFHTFNHLHAAGRQVVISSDRPPKALATLEERLRSRFEGGLQTDISRPDFETRVAILQSKAAQLKFPIHLDVLMLVAERVDSNIRELEGTLNRLVLQARLYSSSLNVSLAETILRNLAPQRTPRNPSIVIDIVAEHYHLLPDDLTGRTRTKDIAHARQVAMYLLREENALSLPNIGDHLGGRDHSTVRHGVEKVSKDLEKDEALRKDLMLLREKIYAAPGS